ncbi:hypothetical protein ROR02_10730 [Pararhodospirillum oryzae]|uniref:Uncharacterized protein n=1 Tax=Pararhodospirillum oryzae TaxID=478448 RepID=A0A512H677_9PROT|nr:hypothetical protein ROR02_10730 [Pararhodospirillum oryzae]
MQGFVAPEAAGADLVGDKVIPHFIKEALSQLLDFIIGHDGFPSFQADPGQPVGRIGSQNALSPEAPLKTPGVIMWEQRRSGPGVC